jgi:hypothetical protein
MKRFKAATFKAVTTVCCIAAMGAVLAPGARADDWNRKTTITFSGPVEIPGVHLKGWGILPAGTYVFKILDSLSDRHIVQIFNQDETAIYATILAIPNYRLKATDKTVLTFTERPVSRKHYGPGSIPVATGARNSSTRKPGLSYWPNHQTSPFSIRLSNYLWKSSSRSSRWTRLSFSN